MSSLIAKFGNHSEERDPAESGANERATVSTSASFSFSRARERGEGELRSDQHLRAPSAPAPGGDSEWRLSFTFRPSEVLRGGETEEWLPQFERLTHQRAGAPASSK